jgi:hypothetical protein
MAKRSFSVATFQAVAVADTTNFVNQQVMGVQGGSATQRIMVSEVMMGGQATASAPVIGVLSRDSTVAATLTALTTNESDAPVDPATAALAAPVGTFTQSTTKGQRSVSAHLLSPSFNGFGGIFRWLAAPYEELIILGNTASNGEFSLSAYTGSTTCGVGAHIIYEAL